MDVFVSGKYAYVADEISGLKIVDINGIETPSLYAGNIQANSITVTENLDIGNDLLVRNGLNVGIGGIATDGAVSISQNASTTADTTALTITQRGTGDILNIFSGTNEIFTILNGGNVGIGTTSPGAALDIQRPSSGDILNISNNLDGDLLTIDFSGNLGVGTSTPQQIFHVDSGATATTTVELGDIYSGTGKTCFNVAVSDGSAGSFYFNTSGIVFETNVCR
ncbi:MAG: hypothetical protein ABIE43_03105 [Patescibacteria group bacterium]